MSEEPGVDAALLGAVGREYQRLRGHRWEHDPELQLPVSAYRILWCLDELGGLTLRELAEAVGLEQSTVNRQVNAALRDGWLTRSREAGRAGHVLSSTAEGTRALAHDRAVFTMKFTRALEAVGPEVARRLVDDLTLLNDAMEDVGRVTP